MIPQLAIEKQERSWVALAFSWFFLLMAGYQILRPIRESLVSDLPSEEKPTLFLVVFFVMLVAVPVFGWVSSVVPRRWLAHVVFHFFVAQLIGFTAWIFLGTEDHAVWQARVFFVWLSVFILFATSVFWSVMADLFSKSQGERLFGPIAAGATLGGIVGSSVAKWLSASLGLGWLLVIAAILLELGLIAASMLRRLKNRSTDDSETNSQLVNQPELEQQEKSGIWAGVIDVLNSPYLRSIAFYIALVSFCGTMVYMQLTDSAKLAIPNRDERTAFFGSLNLYTQVGTLFVQFLLIGPIMKRLGLGVSLSIMPIVFAGSFVLLGFSSSLFAIGLVDVVTRIGTYGVTVPAREVLFTVVEPDEKYKAKNVIDTVVLRGSDAGSSKLYAVIGQFTSAASLVPWLMLPVTAIWLAVAIGLGRGQKKLVETK
jgi:AAA family ATP:ADP antiporter